MLTCREITEGANQYVEGELAWWAKLQFRMHLFMCRHCRRYMDQMESTIRLLRNPPPEEPAPHLEQALLDQFRRWKSRRLR